MENTSFETIRDLDCIERYWALRELVCDVLFAFTESRLADITPQESQLCESIIAGLDDEVVGRLFTRTCEERVSDLGGEIDQMINSESLVVLIRMVTSKLQKADARRGASDTENDQGEGSSSADGPSPEIPIHDVKEEDAKYRT